MNFGASTSCYYPLVTEKALALVGAGGFKSTEIFFNTYSELSRPFVKELAASAQRENVRVLSVHPFSSFAETHCLFGDYQRRVDDIVEIYKKYFDACNVLGANIVVLHGALTKAKNPVAQGRYMERFVMLSEIASSFGVTLAQENVFRHFSEEPDFLDSMKKQTGSAFKLVLDIKQAVRAGYDPFEFIRRFGDDIVHVHISDNDGSCDDLHSCLPPGKGTFDFARLEKTMGAHSYAGEYMIEIYSRGYEVEKELAESKAFLAAL